MQSCGHWPQLFLSFGESRNVHANKVIWEFYHFYKSDISNQAFVNEKLCLVIYKNIVYYDWADTDKLNFKNNNYSIMVNTEQSY